jgi:hypothetical protein
MHHAIDEGERGKHDCAGYRMIALEAFDPCGKVALQALLRAQDPTKDSAKRSRRLLRGIRGGERQRRRCWNTSRAKWIDRFHLGLCPMREDHKHQGAKQTEENAGHAR